MTIEDIKDIDVALYDMLNIITYNTIAYEFLEEKNYVFFKQQYGAYKTTLTQKQITTLASFVAVKLQNNDKMRLKYYQESKMIYLHPEICVEIVMQFIKNNAKRYQNYIEGLYNNRGNDYDVWGWVGKKLKSLITKNNKKDANNNNIEKKKIDDEVITLLSKINNNTTKDTLFVVYESIYAKYKSLVS